MMTLPSCRYRARSVRDCRDCADANRVFRCAKHLLIVSGRSCLVCSEVVGKKEGATEKRPDK